VNATIGKALLLDIFYQTLDNRMFRLLVGLVFVLIAPTFLVSFGDDSISLLFGWKHIDYESIYRLFYSQAVGDHPAQRVIGDVQKWFVEVFAGTLGRSSASPRPRSSSPCAREGCGGNVFAKPVSRGTVLLALLRGPVLRGSPRAAARPRDARGTLARLRLQRPGFLWSAVTLVYLFGILHAVSIVTGVFTRSSVTALLSTMMFFAFNGCIQGGWVAVRTGEALTEAKETAKQDAAPDAVNQVTDQAKRDFGGLLQVLEVVHYILPKTMDASVIARKLRRSLESAPAFDDEETHLVVQAVPAGFVRVEGGAVEGDGIVWTKADAGKDVRFTLRRIERHVDRGEGKRPRSLFPSTVAEERKESLAAEGTATVTSRQSIQLSGGARTSSLAWETTTDGAARHREAHYFSANADWLYALEIDGPPEAFDAGADADETLAFQFLSHVQPPGNVNFVTWYEDTMSWSGPLRFNMWFSIGTTLAFVLALLLGAWWKLARIDF
jgi:hypothetical protein